MGMRADAHRRRPHPRREPGAAAPARLWPAVRHVQRQPWGSRCHAAPVKAAGQRAPGGQRQLVRGTHLLPASWRGPCRFWGTAGRCSCCSRCPGCTASESCRRGGGGGGGAHSQARGSRRWTASLQRRGHGRSCAWCPGCTALESCREGGQGDVPPECQVAACTSHGHDCLVVAAAAAAAAASNSTHHGWSYTLSSSTGGGASPKIICTRRGGGGGGEGAAQWGTSSRIKPRTRARPSSAAQPQPSPPPPRPTSHDRSSKLGFIVSGSPKVSVKNWG